MNLLFTCIGRRGYTAEWFREHLAPGDRILGTSNTRWTPGFHACDHGFLMPEVKSDEYIPALLDLCRNEEVDALFSFFDPDVDRISRHREQFVALGVVPVVPAVDVSRVCFDKWETFGFLTERGFRTPLTFRDLESALQALAQGRLAYPVVVKERCGFASRHLHMARDEEQLRSFFALAPDLIVQERLPGEEHSLDVLNDLDRRVISVIVKRKLLMRAGETDQAESIHHSEALTLGERLGRELGHVGPLDVDFFIDGDNLAVLELNPRFGGAYAVSHLAGADFPRKLVAMLRGERLEPDLGNYRGGVEMMKDYRILPAFPGPITSFMDPDSRDRPPSG